MLCLNFFAYMSLYFVRKPLSVVKAPMQDATGISINTLAAIDTSFLGMYAAGQFILPALGNRLAAKQLLVIGYSISAVACVAFGLSVTPSLFVGMWALNGFAQSVTYSLHVKVLSPWFSSSCRGRAMGVWAASAQFGGMASSIVAAFLLKAFGWRAAVMLPAALTVGAAVAMAIFLREKPEGDALPLSLGEQDDPTVSYDRGESDALSMPSLMKIVHFKPLMASQFIVKLLRYCLMMWLPFFLTREAGMPPQMAAYMSCLFDAAGILGTVATGVVGDLPLFQGRRSLLAAAQCLILVPCLIAIPALSKLGLLPCGFIVALTGFLVAGPEALTGTAAVVDSLENAGVGRNSVGPAVGLVNGVGSLGAVLQGAMAAYSMSRSSLSSLFNVLAFMSAVSVLTLMRSAGCLQWSCSASRLRLPLPAR